MLKNENLTFIEYSRTFERRSCDTGNVVYADYILDKFCIGNGMSLSKFIKLLKKDMPEDSYGHIELRDKPDVNDYNRDDGSISIDKRNDYLTKSLLYKMAKNKKVLDCIIHERVSPNCPDMPHYKVIVLIDI